MAQAAEVDPPGERLARIETQLDMILQRLDPIIRDHETRVRRLEKWAWTWAGGAAVIAAIATKLLGG